MENNSDSTAKSIRFGLSAVWITATVVMVVCGSLLAWYYVLTIAGEHVESSVFVWCIVNFVWAFVVCILSARSRKKARKIVEKEDDLMTFLEENKLLREKELSLDELDELANQVAEEIHDIMKDDFFHFQAKGESLECPLCCYLTENYSDLVANPVYKKEVTQKRLHVVYIFEILDQLGYEIRKREEKKEEKV